MTGRALRLLVRLALTTLLILGGVVGVVLGRANALAARRPATDPGQAQPVVANPDGPFDPVSFGIPETITGYTVLAVITPDNTACTNEKRLVMQVSAPSMNDFLNSAAPKTLLSEAARLGLGDYVAGGVEWVSAGVTPQQIADNMRAWNHTNAEMGFCVQSHPIGPLTEVTAEAP